MSLHAEIFLAIALLLAGKHAPGGYAQDSRTKIPALHGAVLTGEKVNLPEGLNGRTAVLVMGFSQASREEATAWGRRLAGDYGGSGAAVYYEMPVLESVPRLLRGWVLKKIAESVPDQAKGRFLPVLDHEAEWKKAAGFAKADDAYVLVVDGDGAVRARISGEPTDASYAEVKRQVAKLQAIP